MSHEDTLNPGIISALMSETPVDPLTKEECEQWIKDLRSGDYKQGYGRLISHKRTQNNAESNGEPIRAYCCLGILYYITLHNCIISEGDLNGYMIAANRGTIVADYYKLNSSTQSALAALNDRNGKSFEEIADYIEKNILPMCEPGEPK